MLDRQQVLDRYFPEVRAWLIQIAAVMDRHERANDAATDADPRLAMYRESLEVLAGGGDDHAERIQRIFSDPVE